MLCLRTHISEAALCKLALKLLVADLVLFANEIVRESEVPHSNLELLFCAIWQVRLVSRVIGEWQLNDWTLDLDHYDVFSFRLYKHCFVVLIHFVFELVQFYPGSLLDLFVVNLKKVQQLPHL